MTNFIELLDKKSCLRQVSTIGWISVHWSDRDGKNLKQKYCVLIVRIICSFSFEQIEK